MNLIKKIIVISMVILFLYLIIPFMHNVYAVDEKNLSITSVNVTAPEDGIYGVGQNIDITFTFSKPIKGTLPKYTIYFGKNVSEKIELAEVTLDNFSTEAKYKYTIKSGDNGELKPDGFVNPSEYNVETEDGKNYMLRSPFMVSFEEKIYADTTIPWTNFDNAKLTMQSERTNRNDFEIKVENVQINSDSTYYVHFSHVKDEEINIKSIDDIYNNINEKGEKTWGTTINTYSNKVNVNSYTKNIFAEAGEVYIYICEVDRENNLPKIVLKNYEIKRLPNLPLTQRITGYFNSNTTSTFCWEIYGDNERKVNYKIGVLSDKEILNKIRNGEQTAFEELMDFSVENAAIGTGTLKLGEDTTILDKLNLDNNLYYYIYMELDDEEGKYFDIQDVSLYKVIDTGAHKTLISVTDEGFEWDTEGDNSNKDENDNYNDSSIVDLDELPFAGRKVVIGIIITVLIILTIIFYKKYVQYKKLK